MEGAPQILWVMVDGATVRLIGELDPSGVTRASAALESGALGSALQPVDGEVAGEVAVDCSGLTFIDAAGMGVLARAHRTCQASGVELIVVDPAPCVTRLLALTGLDRHLVVRRIRESR